MWGVTDLLPGDSFLVVSMIQASDSLFVLLVRVSGDAPANGSDYRWGILLLVAVSAPMAHPRPYLRVDPYRVPLATKYADRPMHAALNLAEPSRS